MDQPCLCLSSSGVKPSQPFLEFLITKNHIDKSDSENQLCLKRDNTCSIKSKDLLFYFISVTVTSTRQKATSEREGFISLQFQVSPLLWESWGRNWKHHIYNQELREKLQGSQLAFSSYTVQDFLPKELWCPQWARSSISFNNQNNHFQTCSEAKWSGSLFIKTLFPGNSKLFQVSN